MAKHPWVCGFCRVGNCRRCPGTIRNGEAADKPEVECACKHPTLAVTADIPTDRSMRDVPVQESLL